jgi:hypothetical protein
VIPRVAPGRRDHPEGDVGEEQAKHNNGRRTDAAALTSTKQNAGANREQQRKGNGFPVEVRDADDGLQDRERARRPEDEPGPSRGSPHPPPQAGEGNTLSSPQAGEGKC